MTAPRTSSQPCSGGWIDRDRFHLTLCGLSEDKLDLGSLEALVDEIHVLGMRGFFDVSVIAPLYRLLKKSRVDVLHTHRIRPDLVGRIAGSLAGVPINISTQHYVEEWYERGEAVHRVVRSLFKRSMGLCDTIACNSAAEQGVLLQEIGEEFRGKTCVILNGLDTERYRRPPAAELAQLRRALDLPPKVRLLTIVAYLTERKGHRYLLEAIARLEPEHPDMLLLVVGDGPEEAELVRLARSFGIENSVRFLGRRADVPAIVSLCEVAVLPSLWEPFGLAALEAMAVGTPVIATRTGGLPEFIDHGRNGQLVPPGDAEALAEALGILLANPEKARAMGLAGQETVEGGFTARHLAQAYEAIYDRLVESRSRD